MFFKEESGITYCHDIEGLFLKLEQTHVSSEWRLFIDGSVESLKAVLVHNGNLKPSVPVAYAYKMKETHGSMSDIINLIKYDKYKWKICADLKVIAILTGLQGGYTKYCCFLCLWDSRNRSEHYITRVWPERVERNAGTHNISFRPLVDAEDIVLPPLHIKLGLMKQFVKALKEDSPAFEYLKSKFPSLSNAKIKEGVFVGPQIRKLFKDDEFKNCLSSEEIDAWNCFRNVVGGFLGNYRDPNYEILVKEMLRSYQAIGAKMSLKLHFLHSHLDFFPRNLGDMSDEHGERFHQDIKVIEARYKRKCTSHMMGEYVWFLSLSGSDDAKKRRSISKIHF